MAADGGSADRAGPLRLQRHKSPSSTRCQPDQSGRRSLAVLSGSAQDRSFQCNWSAGGMADRWTSDLSGKKRCTAFGAPLVLGNRLVLHHRVKGEEIVEYITGQRRQRSAVGDNRLRRRHRTPETGSCHETFSLQGDRRHSVVAVFWPRVPDSD